MVQKMKKNNDVLCLVVKLILSVFIAFVFSFKYKSLLLSSLSEPIYYQVLVITTIISGYLAIPISYFLFGLYIFLRRKLSKEYNADYISKQIDMLSKANPKKISDTHKEMMKSWGGRDLKSEVQIESVNEEIARLKKAKGN